MLDILLTPIFHRFLHPFNLADEKRCFSFPKLEVI
jgi:hypothetical protein